MTVLETTERIVAEDPVCNACLGRAFADRSFGLTNEERGRALRTALALEDDEPYETPEFAECWVCEGYSGAFEALAQRVVETLDGIGFSTYQVGTRVSPLVEENERLLRESAGLPAEAGETFKSECNREVGKRVGRKTGTEVDFERPDVLALCTVEGDPGSISDHAIDLQINPAFVYGRYRKLERDIPQTEWPCRECGGSGKQLGPDGGEVSCEYCGGSGYLYDNSVEEYTVPPVIDAMDGTEGVFHGAGREDVDARMLEAGRPFAIEIKHPRERTPDLPSLEAEINAHGEGAVEVTGLELATHEMVERVKGLEASKTYRMDVEFAEPVDPERFEQVVEKLDGATIEQDTPQRVSHRRADLTRVREVYTIDGELHGSQHAELTVYGAGGLYVKELISGDEGRTEPSFAGLIGTASVVTALDVIDVRGEDEPFADPAYLRTDRG